MSIADAIAADNEQRAEWIADYPEFAEYLTTENPDNSHPACPIEKGCTHRHLAAYDGRFADLEWACPECGGEEIGDCEHECEAKHTHASE